MSATTSASPGGYFEPVARSSDCPYCTGSCDVQPLKPIADAAYCISLQEQPHRTVAASALFHRVGLCRHVMFYRARRGRHIPQAVWTSHHEVARHALGSGCQRAIVFEDDVWLSRPWERLARRIARALQRLPEDWWCLYLGHFPLKAYFVRPGLMRTRSGCAHAYLANKPLLRWLAETTPSDPAVPVWRRIGFSIDAAMAMLPQMYALFPMAAMQRPLGDHRVDPWRTAEGKRRSLLDPARYRDLVIQRGPRLAEIIAALLSPYHRRTFDAAVADGYALARTAALIGASGLFNAGYYLAHYPDVARDGVNPLTHYLHYGASEGRWPNADAAAAGINPLAHLLASQADPAKPANG